MLPVLPAFTSYGRVPPDPRASLSMPDGNTHVSDEACRRRPMGRGAVPACFVHAPKRERERERESDSFRLHYTYHDKNNHMHKTG